MHPLARLVVDVPDFPKPGILFRDITPLLQTHFREAIDALDAVFSMWSVLLRANAIMILNPDMAERTAVERAAKEIGLDHETAWTRLRDWRGHAAQGGGVFNTGTAEDSPFILPPATAIPASRTE